MSKGESRVNSLPSKRMLPDRALSTPDNVRSRVVLPAPLAPMIANSSPVSRCSETSFSAWMPP